MRERTVSKVTYGLIVVILSAAPLDAQSVPRERQITHSIALPGQRRESTLWQRRTSWIVERSWRLRRF
jgi:hypothetical protein